MEDWIAGLFRYPVKSLGGEEMESIDVLFEGFAGDRVYAVVDSETGYALSAKKEPKLLSVEAKLVDGVLYMIFPSGETCVGEECGETLSRFLGRKVNIVHNTGSPLCYTGLEIDFENGKVFEKTGETRETRFHDSMPIHIINLNTLSRLGLAAHEVARFRPNVVVSMDVEDELLVGGYLQLGDAVLKIIKPTKRCIVITHQQPKITHNLNLLKQLRASHRGQLGLYAAVVKPGYVNTKTRLKFYAAQEHQE